MVRKIFMLLLLLSSATLSAAPTYSVTEANGEVGINYYPTYVSETKHLTTIGYKNNNSWRDIIVDSPSKGRPIHDEVKEILRIIDDALFEAVEVAVHSAIDDISLATYRGLIKADLVGPINTKIITASSGVITVELGGFSFDSEVKLDWRLFTLYGKVNTSTLHFAADYDVSTGRVYNIRDIGNMQIDIDIDGDGLINSIVAEVADVIADIYTNYFIEEAIEEAITDLNNGEYYVQAFDNVILTNTWVIDGIDIGQIIKDAIAGIRDNQYISIELHDWDERYYEGSRYNYYYRNRAVVDVNNSFKFDYGNEPVYSTGNWSNPCAAPGGSNSGCYEP